MEPVLKKFRLLILSLLAAAVVLMTVSLWWAAIGNRPDYMRWIPFGCVAAAMLLYLTPWGKRVWAAEKVECRSTPKQRLFLWGGMFVVLVLLCGGAHYYTANIRPKVFTVRAKKLISEGKLEEAYPLMREALHGGDPEILYYYCAPFVARPEDPALFATGFEMLIESAEQGFVKSQVLVGCIYRDGRGGILQNKSEALRYFQLAADAGDPDGLFHLGSMIFHGNGVTKNEEEGVRLLLAAAEQGQGQAQFMVGYAYEKGRGVGQDQELAILWLRRGAENGNPEAMHILGLSYLGGTGVERDPAQGRYWIERAAEKGSETAKKYLETLVQ